MGWGDTAHVTKLLGQAFDLTFETGVNEAYHGSPEEIWTWYVQGFGPLRQLTKTLPADRVQLLRRDVDEYHAHYAVPAVLHVRREYLLTIGQRR